MHFIPIMYLLYKVSAVVSISLSMRPAHFTYIEMKGNTIPTAKYAKMAIKLCLHQTKRDVRESPIVSELL